MSEILKNVFNHSDKEIKEFRNNMSSAFNESMTP